MRVIDNYRLGRSWVALLVALLLLTACGGLATTPSPTARPLAGATPTSTTAVKPLPAALDAPPPTATLIPTPTQWFPPTLTPRPPASATPTSATVIEPLPAALVVETWGTFARSQTSM